MKLTVEYLDGTKDYSIEESDTTWDVFKNLLLEGAYTLLAMDTESGPVIIPMSSIKKIYPAQSA